MKEASGELNATVVVVLAIGVLIAFFYYTVWPLIQTNVEANSRCNKAICESCPDSNCDYVTCYSKNNPEKKFECVYKG